MIVLDTCVLVHSLTGSRRQAHVLRGLIGQGERILLPSLVLFEWLRGPRIPEEIGVQEALFPAESAIPFGPREAEIAATLYQKVRRPHGREVDLAIAACAIRREASLWTLNPADFEDLPGLKLIAP